MKAAHGAESAAPGTGGNTMEEYRSGYKILVADDEERIRKVLFDFFSKNDFRAATELKNTFNANLEAHNMRVLYK